MSRLHRSILASLLIATGAFADIAIKIPNVVIKNDAKKVQAASKIVASLEDTGSGSSCSLSLADSAVEFSYAVTAGTTPRKATATLSIPLDPTWDYHEISSADSIYFEIKSDVPGTQVNVLVGSPRLSDLFRNPKASLQSDRNAFGGRIKASSPPKLLDSGVVSPSASWQRVGMRFSDFVLSPWYTGAADFDDSIASATKWSGASAPGLNIGTKVMSIRFQPLWDWTDSGKTIRNGAANFYVRKIVIKHAKLYTWLNGRNCTCANPHFQLDQFDSLKSANANVLGGYWFSYTDTNTLLPDDPRTGASHRNFLAGNVWPTWKVGSVGYGAVRATLEKRISGVYHNDAGWVRMGTNFGTDDEGGSIGVQLQEAGMNALSFKLFVGNADGKLPDSLRWVPDKLPYVSLRVGVKGVGDDVAYAIKIPVDQGAGSTICVDLDSMTQPGDSWQSLPWDPTYMINKIEFEAKIADQVDSSIHSAGPVTFAISNVNFYGLTYSEASTLPWAYRRLVGARALVSPDESCGDGVAEPIRPKHSFQASYSNGLTISYNLPGATAQLDILRLDGSRVARLQVPAHASNMHLSQPLARGTYMLALRGEGATQVVPLTVAR